MSQLQRERHICIMKTQTPPAQSKPEMLALENILVPLDFSPASNNAAKKERVMETTVESLATRVALHPFLVGMNRRQLALLTSCAMTVQFNKGQVIFREGDLADRFYLIESGNVALESTSGPDDPLLGWSWMFPPHTWTFTARAAETTTAIFFYGTTLREYCERDHTLGYELLKRMSSMMYQRMQAARNTMLTIKHRSGTLPPVELSLFLDPKLVPYPGAEDYRQSCARAG
jgi:CRP/FNR family transcriptional regulator, cyclic AMP receptor protein